MGKRVDVLGGQRVFPEPVKMSKIDERIGCAVSDVVMHSRSRTNSPFPKGIVSVGVVEFRESRRQAWQTFLCAVGLYPANGPFRMRLGDIISAGEAVEF